MRTPPPTPEATASATRRRDRPVQIAGHVHPLTPRPGDEPCGVPRFGAHRAQWNLVAALRQHPDVELALSGWDTAPRTRPGGAPVRWVHHFGQVFEPEPHRLRAKFGSGVRLSTNHHTLSYPHLEREAEILRDAPLGDTIVASSYAARRVLEHLVEAAAPGWPASIEVIPLPVFVAPRTHCQRLQMRAQLHMDHDDILIVSNGRLSRHDKASLEPLIWMMSAIRAHRTDVRLVIAGDDTHRYSSELARLAQHYGVQEHVRIETDISDERRDDLLHAADLFVSLYDSHQESFGLAVAEAQSAGLPCVCSDFGSIGELVVDDVTGFTVPTRFVDPGRHLDRWRHELPWRAEHERFAQLVWVDRSELLSAVTALCRDPALRRLMSERALLNARRFEPATVAEQYVSMWTTAEWPHPTARRQHPFVAREVFGAFATQVVCGTVRWGRSDERDVLTVIGEDLLATLHIDVDVFRHIAEVARRSDAPLTLAGLATATGVAEDIALLSVAVLGKHGFLETA